MNVTIYPLLPYTDKKIVLSAFPKYTSFFFKERIEYGP